MLHLVGCLYYLYQWWTVKQISDNEIYLLIKHIKSVLWRVVKRLSYIQDARCLKVNQLWILPLPSQYTRIFSIILFVIKNKELFQLNSQVHNIHGRFNDNLHFSSTGLTLVQKGVTKSGCKIYNHLPTQTKNISANVALFRTTLKEFLLQYVFCSFDEYYQQNYNDYDC